MVTSQRAEFSRYLRAIQNDHGYESIADLARLLDEEPATVGRWLSGDSEPSLEKLRRMAPNLRVHIVDLMVAAGLLSTAETGRKASPARPLPKEIRDIMELIDDENIPDYYQKVLLQGVASARKYFLALFRAPKEPAMRQKTRV